MTPAKPSANERVLAKLLDAASPTLRDYGYSPPIAAFLARRGVLAVCAKTVPDDPDVDLWTVQQFRAYLRGLARGAK